MKPQALIVALIVAILVAVGWFAFLSDWAAVPEVAPASADSLPAAAGDAAAASVESRADGGEGSLQPVDAAASRTAVPDLGSAGGGTAGVAMVFGRLVDGRGEPQPQLALQVSLWRGDADDVGRGPNPRKLELVTDADGRFEFAADGRSYGTFSLPADDMVFATDAQYHGNGADQDLGDLTVVRAAALAGIVRDASGRPVADVMVEAALGALGIESSSRTRTAADGRFAIGKLRPGTWTLRTASSRFLPHVERVEVAAGQRRDGLALTLEVGRSISGRVFDDRGVPVAGLRVGSPRDVSVGGVDIRRVSPDEAATTAADGSFTLAGLTGDAVSLRVSGKGYKTVTTPNLATGSTNVELRVDRLASLAGVLTLSDGTPIAGSRVRVENESGAASTARPADRGPGLVLLPIGGGSVTTDERGRFAIEGVEPGTVALFAEGKAHLPVERHGVLLAPAQHLGDVRLVADAGAVARVEVVDEQGRPIEGARVAIARAPARTAGRSTFGTGRTGADGIATVMGLPAGNVVVTVAHADYAPCERTPLALPASGKVEHRIVLGVPGFVVATVSNPDGSLVAGTDVVLHPPGGDGRDDRRVTDADGWVRFGPLAPGIYEVVLVRKPTPRQFGGAMVFVGDDGGPIESSRQTVTVVAGDTAQVALRYPILTRLSGRVLGADGVLAGCIVELDRAERGVEVSGLGGRQAETDADGVYVFEGVEAGAYVLRYGKAGQVVKGRREIEVPAGARTVESDLLLRTGSVRVRVLARDDGEPISGATVELRRAGRPGEPRRQQRHIVMVSMIVDDSGGEESSTMTFGQEHVRTDADGVAVFADVPVGTYTLLVESRSHAPAEGGGQGEPVVVEVREGCTAVQDLTLPN